MRITSELPLRTRRGMLAAGGAALVGCATLGASSDKLQQALKDTEQEVGPVPLLLGVGKDAVGIQGSAISVQSGKLTADLATSIKTNLDKEIEMLMSLVRPTAGGFGEFNIRIVRNSDAAPGT